MLEAWLNAQEIQRNGLVSAQSSYAVTWRKPEVGWEKVNTDTAVFEDYGAVSAIFKDATRRFVGAFMQQVKHITDAQMLVVMANKEVLSWLKAGI